jgi:hypothetical protein
MLTLFKYRCFTTETDKDRVRDILLRQEVYCSTPAELDDPYDCNIGTAAHLMDMLVTHAVFCTSGDRHNDILLFSQYADRHIGMALVFTVDDGGTIGDSTFLGFAKKMTYVDDFPTFDNSNIHKVLWTKYAAWSYQDEYRTIASLDHDSSQYRRFEKHELTEIRFGLNMKEADQQMIMQWASTAGLTGVKFFKARLRKDKFQLAYDQIH